MVQPQLETHTILCFLHSSQFTIFILNIVQNIDLEQNSIIINILSIYLNILNLFINKYI